MLNIIFEHLHSSCVESERKNGNGSTQLIIEILFPCLSSWFCMNSMIVNK